MSLGRYELHLLASQVRFGHIKNKMASANMIIQQMLSQCQHPYLAFSGGKDSGVLLDMALRHKPITIVWLINYPLPGQLQHIAAIEAHYGIQVKRVWVHEWANSEFAAHYGTDLTIPDSVPVDLCYHRMADFIIAHGWDGLLMGMRADESAKRRYVLSNTPLYFVQADGLWHGSPLFNWSVQDVWVYLTYHRLPIHPAYRDMINAGIPLKQCRVDGMDNVRIIEFGLHEQFKRLWPDRWSEFVRLNPCVQNV